MTDVAFYNPSFFGDKLLINNTWIIIWLWYYLICFREDTKLLYNPRWATEFFNMKQMTEIAWHWRTLERMFKKSNAGDQLLLAIKLNKVSEISRLVALGVNVNSRIDKVG